MKRIKLLVVTLFLLAFFSGNALADPAYGQLVKPGTTEVVSNPAPAASGTTVSYGIIWDHMALSDPNTPNSPAIAAGHQVYYFLAEDTAKNTKVGSFSFYAEPLAGTGALKDQLLVTVLQPTEGSTAGILPVNPVIYSDLGKIIAPYWIDPANTRITLTLPSSGVAQGAQWSISGFDTNTLAYHGIVADFGDYDNQNQWGTLERGTFSYNAYNSVPEFPTVALPVAAVLGLLFIIGRKKGDL